MWNRRELALYLGAGAALRCSNDAYRTEVEKWRQNREQGLKKENGWLSLVGLHWLTDGDERTDIAPDMTFRRQGKQITVARKGEPPRPLRADITNSPDILTAGTRTYMVIERGDWVGIRVRDPESPARKGFRGLHWYPVREDYRVTGRLIPYPEPKILSVPTVIPELRQQLPSPGVVEFTLLGQVCKLEPTLEDGELSFVFKDLTAGQATYGAGRFLDAVMPKDGRVELDFNKAYNPPCAFTVYATCPIPLPQNRLKVAVEAGELDYEHDA